MLEIVSLAHIQTVQSLGNTSFLLAVMAEPSRVVFKNYPLVRQQKREHVDIQKKWTIRRITTSIFLIAVIVVSVKLLVWLLPKEHSGFGSVCYYILSAILNTFVVMGTLVLAWVNKKTLRHVCRFVFRKTAEAVDRITTLKSDE